MISKDNRFDLDDFWNDIIDTSSSHEDTSGLKEDKDMIQSPQKENSIQANDNFFEDLLDDFIEEESDKEAEYTEGIGVVVPKVEVITGQTLVDLDKYTLDSKIPNLHREIVLEDSPYLLGKSESINYNTRSKTEGSSIAKGMDNLVVGQNGLTLGDYFKYKRNKYERNSIRYILEAAAKNEDIQLSNQYDSGTEKKRIRLANLKSEYRKELKCSSKDNKAFISKFKKKTPFEKSILKNLGITQEDLNKLVSPQSLLSEQEKAKLLSCGVNDTKRSVPMNTERAIKHYTTFGDLDILEFISLAGFASCRNLHYVTGKGEGSILRQLERLTRMGLTRCVVVYNSPGVWCLTETGAALIGSTRKIPDSRQGHLSNLAERLYVNHVMACLYSGCINILNMQDFPSKRVNLRGEEVPGEVIISESEMVSSMWKFLANLGLATFNKQHYPGERMKVIKENWETTWRKWEMNKQEVSPEFIKGNEWLWMLFYDVSLSTNYVLPDIIVKRERNKDGSPNSIAVEVERSIKTLDEYSAKLAMYKRDNRLYSKVIYIVSCRQIAERILEAAERINFDMFDIVPMQNEDGIVKGNTSHWYI